MLEHLKNSRRTAPIPVVVLSAIYGKNREKLMAAGAEDFLEKHC